MLVFLSVKVGSKLEVILRSLYSNKVEKKKNSDQQKELKPVEKVLAIRSLRKLRQNIKAAKVLSRKGYRNSCKWGRHLVKILRGITSPDRSIRFMTVLFILSLGGALGVLGALGARVWQHYHKSSPGSIHQLASSSHVSSHGSGTAALPQGADPQETELNLGKFIMQLAKVPGQITGSRVMNLAEIEIVILCDKKATRDYIKSHTEQARDQVTRALPIVHRDELMSREGKRKMNSVVLRRLNQWLPKGKIEEIYFSNVLVD